MPADAWIKIFKTHDLIHLYKLGKGPATNDLSERWLDLQQEYFEEFGIDDDYAELIRIQLRLAKLNYEFIITQDRFLLNLIEIAEIELKAWGDGQEVNFGESITYASKYMGFRVNPKEISVLEWGHIIRAMSSEEAASNTPENDELSDE